MGINDIDWQELEFEDICKPPSQEYLANLQQRLGVKFPQDYIDFLMQYNGSSPPYELNTVKFLEGGSYPIEEFLLVGDHIKKPSYQTFEHHAFPEPVPEDEDDCSMPKNVIPFASGIAGGTYFCFDFRVGQGEDTPIVWWCPESYYDMQEDPDQEMEIIAESFLACLVSMAEAEEY